MIPSINDHHQRRRLRRNFMMCGNRKAGCKGDPRMNRAVAARMRDPTLSLSAALFVGGFNYPSSDEASTLDDENITLGQRKNQLLRRLREANRKSKSALSGPSIPPAASNMDAGITNTSEDHHNTLLQLSQQNCVGDGWNEGPSASVLGSRSPPLASRMPVDMTLSDPSEDDDHMLRPFSQQSCIGAGPSASDAKVPSFQYSSGKSTPPYWDSKSQDGSGNDLKSMSPNFDGMAPGPGVLTALPTPATITTVLGGLSALGVPPQDPRSEAHSSASQPNRPTLFDPMPNDTVTSPSTEDAREKEGLLIFHEGLQDLYRQSMLKAGYSPEETQPSSRSYQRFAFLAWQQECLRLQSVFAGDLQVSNSPDMLSSSI